MSIQSEDPPNIVISRDYHFSLPKSSTSPSSAADGTASVTITLPSTEEEAAKLRRVLGCDLEKSFPGATSPEEVEIVRLALPREMGDAIFGTSNITRDQSQEDVIQGNVKDLFSTNYRSGTDAWNWRSFSDFLQGKSSREMQCPVHLRAGDEDIAAMATIQLAPHVHQPDIGSAVDAAAGTTAHTFSFNKHGVLESEPFSLTSVPCAIKTASGRSHCVDTDASAKLIVELPQDARSRRALETAIESAESGGAASYPDLSCSSNVSAAKARARGKPVRWEQGGVRVESMGPRSTSGSSQEDASQQNTDDGSVSDGEPAQWPVRLTSADGKEVLGLARYRLESTGSSGRGEGR